MEESIPFAKISTPVELVDFLKKKGGNHNYYYHYTNLDALNGMIQSKFWHISNGRNMNDHHEFTKGETILWDDLFISSFVFGGGEHMAMWGLYSLPWQRSIRIMIPRDTMKRWMNEPQMIYKLPENVSDKTYTPISNDGLKIDLTDVAYISGKSINDNNRVQWSREYFDTRFKTQLMNLSKEPEITGYLKNQAWQYENETRIRVQSSQANGCKIIAIKMPDYVLESITVTRGPWFEVGFEEEILRCKRAVKDIKTSEFKDLVFYRKYCDFCENSFINRI